MALGLGVVLALVLIGVGTRELDNRRLALLAVIAALDAALRLALVTGIAGFSPIFFLVICAGYVFGPSFGFLAGAVALLTSALATGGVGPWLPYELFGVGWTGMAAGFAGTAAPRPELDPVPGASRAGRSVGLCLRVDPRRLGLELLPGRSRHRVEP
jgi:energy-coupling factor transport system substrate-specific component